MNYKGTGHRHTKSRRAQAQPQVIIRNQPTILCESCQTKIEIILDRHVVYLRIIKK